MPVAWSQSKGFPTFPLGSRSESGTMEACIFCVFRVNSFLAKLLCPGKLSSRNSNEIKRVSSLSVQYLGSVNTSRVRGVWGDLSEEMSTGRKNLKTIQFSIEKEILLHILNSGFRVFTALLKIRVRIFLLGILISFFPIIFLHKNLENNIKYFKVIKSWRIKYSYFKYNRRKIKKGYDICLAYIKYVRLYNYIKYIHHKQGINNTLLGRHSECQSQKLQVWVLR